MFIVEPAREEALNTWSEDYRCSEVKCDIVDDHFTHDEQHKMYHEETDVICAQSECSFNRKIDGETAKVHRAAVLGHDGICEWRMSHDGKRHRWTAKVDLDHPTCIFTKHQTFVRSRFGINIWTSNVRLPPLERARGVEPWRRNQDQNTTRAYITLPNNGLREVWDTFDFDSDGDLQSGYSMPVNLGAVPTQASLRRFPRAMKLLGLEVFVDPTQKGTVISAQTDVESTDAAGPADGSLASWPQLTLLTRCRTKEP